MARYLGTILSWDHPILGQPYLGTTDPKGQERRLWCLPPCMCSLSLLGPALRGELSVSLSFSVATLPGTIFHSSHPKDPQSNIFSQEKATEMRLMAPHQRPAITEEMWKEEQAAMQRVIEETKAPTLMVRPVPPVAP